MSRLSSNRLSPGRTRPILPLCKTSVVLALLFINGLSFAATELTLAAAEQLALGSDPVVAAALARSRAWQQQSVADGELQDPKFTVGLFNVPLDNLDIRREPTTQLRLGLHQQFPKGDTLDLRSAQSGWRASAETARAESIARQVLRDVRQTWLNVYFSQQAQEIIRKNRVFFSQLVNITSGQYGAGRAYQQDVLRAELELAKLEDRIASTQLTEDTARGELAKWLPNQSLLPLPAGFPTMPDPADFDVIFPALARHPEMSAQSAAVEAEEKAVAIAQELYKPGWRIGAEYRKRFGNDPAGSDRSDMLAIIATIDLPMFASRRQDKRVAAASERANAAWFSRNDKMRILRSQLEQEKFTQQGLRVQLELFDNRLLPDAQANSTASLSAYQSGVSEFTTLMRARITQLDLQLQALRLKVDLAKSTARLLYLDSTQPTELSGQNTAISGRRNKS